MSQPRFGHRQSGVYAILSGQITRLRTRGIRHVGDGRGNSQDNNMFIIKISKQIENKVPISYLMREGTEKLSGRPF